PVIRQGATPLSYTPLSRSMVAITVVLAAVLYVMVSGLISPVSGNKPLVTFSSVTQSSGNATIGVAGASQAVSPSNYKVNLAVAGTTGNAVAMPTTRSEERRVARG